jgi:alanyl-tRNA synthetase
MVNSMIRSDFPLEEKRDATMEEALGMGAIALFGEKYGDRVRVVRFGESIELCGGTHTSSTGTIGLFKIVSESAVAAGVRRIEAITGGVAVESIHQMEGLLKNLKGLMNNAPDLQGAIEKLVQENADARKQLEAVAAEKAAALADRLLAEAEDLNGIRVARFESSLDPQQVRNVALLLQKKAQNLVLAGAYHKSYEEAESYKRDPAHHREILPVLRPVAEKVAAIISRHIAGKEVAETWLVGGSSCLTGIEDIIARQTGVKTLKPEDPMFVTPLGIAVSCMNKMKA